MRSELWLMLFCFMGSCFLTPLVRHYALRRQLIDIPNARSSHDMPTPRGGGAAIVIAYLVGMMFFLRSQFSLIFAFAGAGIIVAAVGIWDDHKDIQPRWRVTAHFFAVFWAWMFLVGVPSSFEFTATGWLINLFLLVSMVWLVNLFNFMDGIDTLAGAEAVFVGLCAALFFALNNSFVMAWMSAMFAAAVAGFLFWNLPPARIFMGDVGSGFIGIVLGFIALIGIISGAVNVWVWLILLGVFLVDATMTVARRILLRTCWYAAHCSHAYQHAAQRLGGHGKVTAVVTGINVLWLLPWAMAAYYWPTFGIVFTAAAYVPLVWLAYSLNAGRNESASLTT